MSDLPKADWVAILKYKFTLAGLVRYTPTHAKLNNDGMPVDVCAACRDIYEITKDGVTFRVIIETDEVTDPAVIKTLREAEADMEKDYVTATSTPTSAVI